MNRSMTEQLSILKTALEFYIYDRDRQAAVGNSPAEDFITPVLQKGIGDLDFDHEAFLLYGQDEPAGWAIKKE